MGKIPHKTLIINLAKFILVAGLLTWMVRSDRLHLQELTIYIREPMVLILTIVFWFTVSLLMATYRWHILLKGGGVDCPFPRTIRLQLIGYFFNAAMPGAVGGDIIKAVYIYRDQQEKRRTPAMLAVLLDRILGLVGLFLMGGISSLFFLDQLLAKESTRALIIWQYVVIAIVGIGLAFVYIPYGAKGDPILRLLDKDLPGFSTFKKIYEALRSYRHQPMVLVSAIGISMVIQFSGMVFMWYLGRRITGLPIGLDEMASVYPLGILITAIPVAPGGIGVGHLAFDKLFALVGIVGGANIFNVWTLGQLSLNLLGFIPYLSVRSRNMPAKLCPS